MHDTSSPFEDRLRAELRSGAQSLRIEGRGPDSVIARADQRRHRQRAAAGAFAIGVLLAGAVGAASLRDGQAGDGVTSDAQQVAGLPEADPLELTWQSAPGGVTNVWAQVDDPVAGTFVLSTAPGARLVDPTGSSPPKAVYRLSDDGTWEAVVLGGDLAATGDLAGAGGVLYAISTSPAAAGVGFQPFVSASGDGGRSWSEAPLAPVVPPSGVVEWKASSMLQVAAVPSATVALVTTWFTPDVVTDSDESAAASQGRELRVEPRDDGVAVISYSLEAPPELAPDGEPATTLPSGAGEEELRVVSWAEVGVDGPQALGPVVQTFVQDGDDWVGAPAALNGLDISNLEAVGDRLVLTAWSRESDVVAAPSAAHHLTSTDGRQWTEVSGVSENGQLLPLGDSLVDVPWSATGGGLVVRASGDAGATWARVDLESIDGRLDGSQAVASVDSGPLGLAIVTADARGRPGYLATTRDLVHWSVTPVAELLGRDDLNPVVMVGADHVVLTASIPAPAPGGVAESITLIGTPS